MPRDDISSLRADTTRAVSDRWAANRAKRAAARRKNNPAIEYVFGLALPKSRSWIEARWADLKYQDRSKFVREVLFRPGPHILPLFEGDEKLLTRMRQQHLERLILVFGEDEILRM